MIYFDNAATTWPKPPEVIEAVSRCIRDMGANPGRAGHKMSVKAGEMVDSTRKKLAGLFNIDPSQQDRVVFTVNATGALNLAIKGLLKKRRPRHYQHHGAQFGDKAVKQAGKGRGGDNQGQVRRGRKPLTPAI